MAGENAPEAQQPGSGVTWMATRTLSSSTLAYSLELALCAAAGARTTRSAREARTRRPKGAERVRLMKIVGNLRIPKARIGRC